MKLGPFLLRAGVVAGLAMAAGQWWLVQRAHEDAARFIARLVPHGELRYERLLPLPWGAGRAWGVSFQPEGLLRVNFHLPPGFRIKARELRIDRLHTAPDGTLDQLRGRLLGVRAPVAALRAATPQSNDPMRIAPPTLHDLGYAALEFDLAFDLRYVRDAELALLDLELQGPAFARTTLRAQLEGRPQTFSRAPDQILVRKLVLDYADQGLLARYREVWAARARIGLPAWENAVIAHLDRRAEREHWKWDADTAAAARQLIRDPAQFQARVDPPGDVILRNIRLYALADWPALLGFSLSPTAEFGASALQSSRVEQWIDSVLGDKTESARR